MITFSILQSETDITHTLNPRLMLDFGNHTTQIILAIIAAVAGAGLIFKFAIKRKSTSDSGSVQIKDSKIGGDVAGRDIKK